MTVFMIVGKGEPLYELEIGGPAVKSSDQTHSNDTMRYLHQFTMFSSLDMINSTMWTNNATFLKMVDKFNFLLVSAFVSHGGKVLLLLHDGKSEDGIHQFFIETHELLVKYMMNPFAVPESPIVSPYFDSQVRLLGKRML